VLPQICGRTVPPSGNIGHEVKRSGPAVYTITEGRNLLPLATELLPRVKAWLTTDDPDFFAGLCIIYSIGEPRLRWREQVLQ